MHDSKKGKRNDQNLPFGDLKTGNYWNFGISLAATIALAYLTYNDVTGVGIVDDILIPPVIYLMEEVAIG